MAAADDEDNPRSRTRTRTKNKKKKARKDKWGQPLDDTTLDGVEQEYVGGGGGGEEAAGDARYEEKKVVASGMPYSATEDDIRGLFEGAAGPVAQLQISRFPDSGNFRGLAFLTFKTKENAMEALKLDGTKMGNRFVKVERCRLDPQRKRKHEFCSEPEKVEGCYTAYIGNLSFDVTEDDLRNLFDTSKIASIRFAINRKSGQLRGFGHVDFEDDESLEHAISKNQVELHGRPIKIAYAVSNRA